MGNRAADTRDVARLPSKFTGLRAGGVAVWMWMAAACSSGSARVVEGAPAPAFEIRTDTGEQWSSASFRGRWLVLYFYPKDGTSGCTAEATGFRDLSAQFETRGATVVGVSLDDAAAHAGFRQELGLKFALATNGAALARTFGVPVNFGFSSRQTFLIDPQGRLARVFRSVDPEQHAAEVLRLIDTQSGGQAAPPAAGADR